MTEIEVKIKISDPKSLQKKIITQGAQLLSPRHLEENIFYDFPSQDLHKKRNALRLRRIHKKGYLTFKGPPQKSRKFKIREEYETEIKNVKQLQKILKNLGLNPVFQYKKHRTILKKKNLVVCIDETDIGNYIELEGEQNEIVKFSKGMGFSKNDFIKLDYVQMLKNEEAGKP